MNGAARIIPPALSGKQQRHWPHPTESTGEFLKSTFKFRGRISFWRAKGPARQTFKTLGRRIVDYLDKNCDEPRNSGRITLSVYMTGRTPQDSHPVILFCSEDRGERKRARKAILRSGILDEYPGIEAGDARTPLDLDQLKPLAFAAESHRYPQGLLRSGAEMSTQLSGNRIINTTRQFGKSSTRLATFGGLVRHGDSVSMFTADHVLDTDCAVQLKEASTIEDDLEIDLDWQSDRPAPTPHVSADFSVSTVQPEGQTNNLSRTAELQQPPVSQKSATASNTPRQVQDRGAAGSSLGFPTDANVIRSAELDYALLQAEDSAPLLSHIRSAGMTLRRTHIIENDPNDNAEVVSLTASGSLMTGTLDGTPSFTKLPNSRSFQEVYTAQFDGPLAEGDCGSWVLDAETGGLYGHIIAGSESQGIAHIVPARDVFDHAKKLLGPDPMGKADLTLEALTLREDETVVGDLTQTSSGQDCPGPICSTTSTASAQRHRQGHPNSRATAKNPGDLPQVLRKARDFIGPKPGRAPNRTSCGADYAGASDKILQYSQHLGTRADGRCTIPEHSARQTRLKSKAGRRETSWPSAFITRPKLDPPAENDAYVDRMRESDEDSEIVRIFKQADKDCDDFSPFAEAVKRFCTGASFLASEEAEQRSVAWLDETCSANGQRQAQIHGNPLTAAELYDALRRRFCAMESVDHVADQDQAKSLEEVRRLIFITDPDPSSIYALVATAPQSQVASLHSGIYRHLRSNTYLGVSLPSKGLAPFEFTFHLRFFAWRSTCAEDHRRDKDGNTLRNTQDVSFVHGSDTTHTSFLHSATVSCVITGLDEYRWTAYCLVDTYFDGEGSTWERILDYHKTGASVYDRTLNPLTHGKLDADGPIHDPREHFFAVLASRLGQVKREWDRVMVNLEQCFPYYERSIIRTPPTLRREGQYESRRQMAAHLEKMSNFIIQLSDSLKEMIDVLAHFQRKHAGLLAQTESLHVHLCAIEKTYDEFVAWESALDQMLRRCLHLGRVVEMDLASDALYLSKAAANFSRKVLMYLAPLIITTGIFSMSESVLPFIRPNVIWFFGLILVFSLLGLAVDSVFDGNMGVLSLAKDRVHRAADCSRSWLSRRWKRSSDASDVEKAQTPWAAQGSKEDVSEIGKRA
ncbi:hypothetical protein PV04_01548 [Phialophora macrospora]|uniref:Uncharacterized protein n=1 Tax=Phialophora macrospora TaxID=1851006 RepID=A0A0D2EGE6_9EURO|nr:hypothetical protein PV04_01548 [Phialophora macrospora]